MVHVIRALVTPTFMHCLKAAKPMISEKLAKCGKVTGLVSTGVGAYQLHQDWDKYNADEDKAWASLCFGLSAAGNIGGARGTINAIASIGVSVVEREVKFVSLFASQDFEFVRTDEQRNAWFEGIVKIAPAAIALRHQPLGDFLSIASTAHDVKNSPMLGDLCSFVAGLEQDPAKVELLVMMAHC